MEVEIITPAHLQEFREHLLKEIKEIVEPNILKPGKWVRSEVVKKALKIAPASLQQLRINRTLRFTKIGGIYYYDYEHIQKLINDNIREVKDNQ